MALKPGSPAWWLDRLGLRLLQRARDYDLLERYVRGDHPLPYGDERVREAFRAYQRTARTNYTGLVVSALAERLRVLDIRIGNNDDDNRAWEIWQANHLDADADLVHQAALTFGEAYVIVGQDPETGEPVITPEDPRRVIAEVDPIHRRTVRAALKYWYDPATETKHAVLYLPDAIYGFQAPRTEQFGKNFNPLHWSNVEEYANPWGVVPVERFVNRPNLRGEGMSEISDIIDIQDRINTQILDRLVIAKSQAYRQRFVKGAPETDEAQDQRFFPGVDLLWVVEDPDVEFGEFQQVDLSPLLDAVREDVKALVTLTSLPPHYVSGDLVNASADAISAAESRHVNRARMRARTFGESWERVARLAFRVSGVPGDAERAEVPSIEVVWADPERKSDAVLADAAVKKASVGVPWRQLMADLGYTPEQIDRMEALRAQDSLFQALRAAQLAERAPTPPADSPETARTVTNARTE